MKAHLNEIISPQQNSRQRSTATLVVLEHNLTRSPIPLLRVLLDASPKGKGEDIHAILICLLHAPSVLITDASQGRPLQVLHPTDRVSNFGAESNATDEALRASNEVLAVIQESKGMT